MFLLALVSRVGVVAAASRRRLTWCCLVAGSSLLLLLLLLLGLGHADKVVEGEGREYIEDDVDPEDTKRTSQ